MKMMKSDTIVLSKDLVIPVADYASAGNAVLGIRDSGKTYSASYMAEQLIENGIPITVFDPIGIWRWLRVPAPGGKGFPVVVAGGEEGDIPLKPQAAEEIMKAAMDAGISIVFDLYDMHLSKADWKRIVTAALRAMLYHNKAHGPRHIFIEESAEFAPQVMPKDGVTGHVYDQVEKLARMGGNAALGYTLINQRAEQVNKAVLELCDCLFLHRQKGKNSIASLEKWLQFSDKDVARKVVASLPTLPTGTCWVWPAKAEAPTLVNMPRKRSHHPDRRAAAAKTGAVKGHVDVSGFVEQMQGAMAALVEEAEANDPAKLKAQIRALEQKVLESGRLLGATVVAADPAAIEDAYQRGYNAKADEAYQLGHLEGVRDGWKQFVGLHDELQGDILAAVRQAIFDWRAKERPTPLSTPPMTLPKPAQDFARREASGLRNSPSQVKPVTTFDRKPNVTMAGDGQVAPSEAKILGALEWWRFHGHQAPSRAMVAAIAGYKPNGGRFQNLLGAMKSAGLIDYPQQGFVSLTEAGAAAAPAPDLAQDKHDRIRAILGPSERKLFDSLLEARGDVFSRQELAEAAGYDAKGGRFQNLLGYLRNSLELITYPQQGCVALAEWAQ